VLIVFLLIALRVLPLEVAVILARLLVRIYATFTPIGRSQLDRARKELGHGRFKAKDYLECTAFNLALMARMGTGLSRRLTGQGVVKGEENVERLKDRGDAAVVATFHYGPWELLAETFTRKGYPLAALVGGQRMRIFEAYLAALRRRVGLSTVTDLNAASGALKRGVFLATLLDKTRRAKNQAWGLPYSDYNVSVIPQRLAKRTGSTLIPVMCLFRNRRLEITVGSSDQEPCEFFAPFFQEAPFEWLVWGE
jgi:lauroyl/myristoyl acyltransferase